MPSNARVNFLIFKNDCPKTHYLCFKICRFLKSRIMEYIEASYNILVSNSFCTDKYIYQI